MTTPTGGARRSPSRVVTSWRFWALVGLTIVDGVTVMIPLTALGLLGAALVAPHWLRRAARFLDELADAG